MHRFSYEPRAHPLVVGSAGRRIVIACHVLRSEERHFSQRDGRQKSDPTSVTFPTGRLYVRLRSFSSETKLTMVELFSAVLRKLL